MSLTSFPRINKLRRFWNIHGDNDNLGPSPATDYVYRNIIRKSQNKTTFTSPCIGILLKNLTLQQGVFNLMKGQLIRPSLNIRM